MFMKKLIIVLAVGMIASNVMGQSEKTIAPPPPRVKSPKPPPPPPVPENVKFTPPAIIKDAPPPPPAPKAPVVSKVHFTAPVIVNEKGYAMLVKETKEEPVILLTKKGVTQRIRMSIWNAKPAYFEKKYGKLPPPPPPIPPVKEQ
jgi:hypothetical protein